MAPILHKIDASPPANAVRMLADIIGLELELKDLDFVTLEHKSPEYLKLNPIGAIPTLQDGDFVLSDSHAIMKYLLSKYAPEKKESLYPSDVRAQALVDQALFFNASVFFIRVKNVALPSIFDGLSGPTEKDIKDIEGCYSVLEAYLQTRKYIAADHLTIVDLAVGSTANAMQTIYKLDANKYPRAADWLSRLEQESFFQKILIPGTQILGHVLNMFWEKNENK